MAAFSDGEEYRGFCRNILSKWKTSDVYKFVNKKGRPFIFDSPPPTVSGDLHMGHVFSYCHADVIARFRRMYDKENHGVFYSFGIDTNGLPTERLIEKISGKKIAKENRSEMAIELKNCINLHLEKFNSLFGSLGLSYDPDLFYDSSDSRCSTVAQWSFLDLLKKGEIYSSYAPTLWDVVDKTSIAQAEIVDKQINTEMHYIDFFAENGQSLLVATTRPELLAACVAVFYNPNDERYSSLSGTAFSPLFGAQIPILPDEDVIAEKGTGLVMCCLFGDELDLKWYNKYKNKFGWDFDSVILQQNGIIKLSNIESTNVNIESTNTLFGRDIVINQSELKTINGKTVSEARKITCELLKKYDLLKKSESIVAVVKTAERSGAKLEIIPTRQWYVRAVKHSSAVRAISDSINWYPKFMKRKMDDWIEGLRWDWCISRNRTFGICFPGWWIKRNGKDIAFIDEDINNIPINFSEKKSPPGCEIVDTDGGGVLKCKIIDKNKFCSHLYKTYDQEIVRATEDFIRNEIGEVFFLEPENAVMDTWFTSSMTPTINAIYDAQNIDGINKLANEKHIPSDLRIQSHEIIRTWAYYTILKSKLHFDVAPWRSIMISGWCLADDRKKMSKSAGNSGNPVDVINELGPDAVRYWASLASLGKDVVISKDVMNQGRRLVNKLYNAANFVLSNLGDKSANVICNEHCADFHPIDVWMIEKIDALINSATDLMKNFEFAAALRDIEDCFWKAFCDRYLEFVKHRIYGNRDGFEFSESEKKSARFTLCYAMANFLKLFAPFLPFVSEYLFEKMLVGESVHKTGGWPERFIERDIIAQNNLWFCECVCKISDAFRMHRSQLSISLSEPLVDINLMFVGKIDKKIAEFLTKEISLINWLTNPKIELLPENSSTSDEAIIIPLPPKDNNEILLKIYF